MARDEDVMTVRQASRAAPRRAQIPQDAGGIGLFDLDLVTNEHYWSPQLERLWGRQRYWQFLLASLLCVFIAAPIGGASWEAISRAAPDLLMRAGLLSGPETPGAFAGTHYASLNGSMWTILHEFRCYLLVMLLGLAGASFMFAVASTWIVLSGVLRLGHIFKMIPSTVTAGNQRHSGEVRRGRARGKRGVAGLVMAVSRRVVA